MNQKEIIAALTIELTRIGKMPEWIRAYEGFIYDAFASKISPAVARNYEAVLSALLGVAAEVVADKGVIVEAAHGGYAVVSYYYCNVETPTGGELHMRENLIGEYECFQAYPEAVIAALKQVENGK